MNESIQIEYVKKATDKRGGHMVHFCRTVIRGKSITTRWKDVRFLDGKFEKWPGRWSILQLDVFQQNVQHAIEQHRVKLDAGEELPFRSQDVTPGEYLFRDAEAMKASASNRLS